MDVVLPARRKWKVAVSPEMLGGVLLCFTGVASFGRTGSHPSTSARFSLTDTNRVFLANSVIRWGEEKKPQQLLVAG